MVDWAAAKVAAALAAVAAMLSKVDAVAAVTARLLVAFYCRWPGV